MEEERKSKLLVVIFWLAAIGCFIFGYYNTVMGLKMFDAFGSSAGSWFLAIIPLVMVFGGYYASVQGKKGMLALYLTGEVLFFVFNLTYLYPQYLGRTLITEEAKALKDTVSVYNGRFDNIVIKGDAKLQRLYETQTNLLDEIKIRNGFGEHATEQLRKYNELAGTTYTPSRKRGENEEEKQKLYDEWKEKTDKGIYNYIIHLNGDANAAKTLIACKAEMDTIFSEYIPKIEEIIKDNSDVSIDHSDVGNNPQIKLLNTLTSKLDKIAKDVNSVRKPEPFSPIVTGRETIAFLKTQKLGTFEHTIISVKERINKLDSWGVIIICFFFDLLGPFLFYFYLRKEDEENGGFDNGAFDLPWWKRWLGLD